MFKTIMHEYSFQILLLIVCAAATAIGFGCRELYKRHIDSQEKEAVAFSAAAFVEQTFKNLHGVQKLQQALEAAEILLAARGIKFSAAEMKILIEAAVGQFNDAFNRDAAYGAEAQTTGTGEPFDVGAFCEAFNEATRKANDIETEQATDCEIQPF